MRPALRSAAARATSKLVSQKRACHNRPIVGAEGLESRVMLAGMTLPGSTTRLESQLPNIALMVSLPSSPAATQVQINWGDGTATETHASGNIIADLAAGNYAHDYSSYAGHPSQSHSDVSVDLIFTDNSTNHITGSLDVVPAAATIFQRLNYLTAS